MDRKTALSEHLINYRKSLLNIYDSIDIETLEKIVNTLVTAFKNGNNVYFAGNGGSAATASHMQCDFGFFVRYFTKFRPKVRALTDCVPMLTAVGNDTSYDDVFLEQLRGVINPGDVLLTISASGNSKNVIKAAEYANEMGATTVCFVGFEGGKLKDVSHIAMHTPNPKGEYGPIEDIHMILDHVLVSYIVKDKEFLEFPECLNLTLETR